MATRFPTPTPARPQGTHARTALGPPAATRLPDFLIVGAMKSGTTTLHRILDRHPDIFLPLGELFFFDIDDFQQHPDTFVYTSDGWTYLDYEAEFERYFAWYAEHFAAAAPGQLVGEDTTTYLASQRAPERIHALLPQAQIIVLLRDPVARLVSHYWHLVRHRRAIYTLEEMLQRAPENLLVRGHYREQLERYLRFFPRERVKVVLFERLVANTQETIDDVCTFLGLEGSVDTSRVSTWSNKTVYPRSLRFQLLFNRLAHPVTSKRRLLDEHHFRPEPAGVPTAEGAEQNALVLSLRKRVMQALGSADSFNRRNGASPPLNPHTRAFLAHYFARENAGLSELLGEDVAALWPNLKGYTL